MINYHDYRLKELSDLEETIGYLQVVLEEYQNDGDTFGFLIGLRNVIEAQGGATDFGRRTKIEPKDWLSAASINENQDPDTLKAVLNDLGDQLLNVRLEDESLDAKYTEILNCLVPAIDHLRPHLKDSEPW